MKRKNVHFCLFCIFPLFLWMGFIFYMSAQTAETSSGMSLNICYLSGELMVPHFSELSVAKQLTFAQGIETIVRKIAHGTEYAILGVLMLRVWSRFKPRLKSKWMVWGYVSCVFYAITDEFHQLFVLGRSCKLLDVLIDSTGVAFGLLVYVLVKKIWRRKTFGQTKED